ncbi:MAG: NUDIX hydrolase [Candidatus Paceibacterota bacterium]
MDLKQPALAVDCVVFNEADQLLLIRRKNEPFQGQYALPGGFVEIGETVEQAARRELQEETSVEAADLHLIGVYSDPKRDPRRHVISVSYLALLTSAVAVAGDDAATAEFISDWRSEKLAFDHNTILEDALRVRAAL